MKKKIGSSKPIKKYAMAGEVGPRPKKSTTSTADKLKESAKSYDNAQALYNLNKTNPKFTMDSTGAVRKMKKGGSVKMKMGGSCGTPKSLRKGK